MVYQGVSRGFESRFRLVAFGYSSFLNISNLQSVKINHKHHLYNVVNTNLFEDFLF